MDIKNVLEKFLLSELAVDIDPNIKTLGPDEDLISTGMIDSLGIMKLVAFMEKTFGIKINNDEIVPENFQTLSALTEFVNKKIKK